MTSTASTQAYSFPDSVNSETIFTAITPASMEQVGASSASTLVGRLKGRVGGYVLPFVIGAVAAIGPPLPVATRRFYSRGEISSSEIGSALWLLNDLVFTEEPATIEQILALNALLALPAVEGFRLELPE